VANIFISYTSADRDWAFWIGHELEALGHTPHVHEWEISGGGNIIAWMEDKHHDADHILCVVSTAYLKAPYSSFERQAGQWAAATNRPNFLLPVFVEPCEAPTLFAPLKRCDVYSLGEVDARARLKTLLAPAAKPPRGAFPGSTSSSPSAAPASFPDKTALSNIPIRIPEHFLGRDDALAAIETALARYEGRVAITALHGLRGVGKTTLAAAFADRHRGDYRATWWIRAQSQTSMRADLVALGIRLGWVGADDKEEPAVDAVMERLRHQGEGILLIFDNAIDANALRPYLPRGGAAKVLVTSNAHAWRGVAAPVEIRLWPREIGGEYLIARTGRPTERAAAETLSRASLATPKLFPIPMPLLGAAMAGCGGSPAAPATKLDGAD
jgi:TIR domain